MDVLLTFTGFHDPYFKGLVDEEEQPGPILTLLSTRSFDQTNPGVLWEICGRTPKRRVKVGCKNKNGTAGNGRSSAVKNARRI